MDILGSCTYYTIDTDKIKNEDLYNYLIKYWGVCDDNILIALDGLTISKYQEQFGYDCFRDSIDIASAEVLEDQLEAVLEGFIGKFPYYLVYSENVEEDGISGYKLCKEITNTVTRSFDFPDSLVYIKDIKNGIECKEDGSTTYIIGLTADEYENINGADFDKVSNFVNKLV